MTSPTLILLLVIAAITPGLFVFIPQLFPTTKSSKTDGQCVSWRPPGWVYSVGWTVLALFAGLSWVLLLRSGNTSSTDIKISFSFLLFVLFALCPVWTAFYHNKERKRAKENAANILFVMGIIAFASAGLSFWTDQAPLMVTFILVSAWITLQLAVSISELRC